MSKETLEHISSFMDGEFSRETGLFLTRRLSADEELTASWERYHLIRDCIRYQGRHQGGRISVRNFSQRIKVALSEHARFVCVPLVGRSCCKLCLRTNPCTLLTALVRRRVSLVRSAVNCRSVELIERTRG